jgi:hypothetical protein
MQGGTTEILEKLIHDSYEVHAKVIIDMFKKKKLALANKELEFLCVLLEGRTCCWL